MKKGEYGYTSFARMRAKELRHNMTPAERHLWYDYLRGCPWKFQRQKAIGPYIVDFVCFSVRLILELDGNSHDDGAYDHDERRTKYLEHANFRILRLSNRDIRNHFNDVCNLIERAINDPRVQGRISSDAVGDD